MWIEKDKGSYRAFGNEGKSIALCVSPEAALQAIWVDLGKPSEYTLYLDEDGKTIHKKHTELPT